MNLKTLPNYPALEELYRQYYENVVTDESADSSHISSHWQIYRKASHIKIDRDGNLVHLEGKGFGGYEQVRLSKRAAGYLCCMLHFLRSGKKPLMFTLSREALSLVKKIPFNRHYLSYDLFRQIDALSTIMSNCQVSQDERITVLIIGDGFGFLSALVKSVYPRAQIILVDIGSTLLFQCLYLQALNPDRVHHVVGCDLENARALSETDFLYCPAEKLDQLRYRNYKFAINVCSMQEMHKAEIERYFRHLRVHGGPDSRFYCCNRESKVLPDGEKVEFEAFPWLASDQHIIDGYPSVYRFWVSAKLKGNGPRVCGIRVPFLDGPDGPIRHRLSCLSAYSENAQI